MHIAVSGDCCMCGTLDYYSTPHLRLKAKLNCHVQQPLSGSSPFSLANDSPSWIIFNMSTLHLLTTTTKHTTKQAASCVSKAARRVCCNRRRSWERGIQGKQKRRVSSRTKLQVQNQGGGPRPRHVRHNKTILLLRELSTENKTKKMSGRGKALTSEDDIGSPVG